MPKYAHHTLGSSGLAIWQITESSDELYALLATDKYDNQLAEKHHEARRTEWLAVRVLVKKLFGAEAEVAYHHTGRPYLKESDIHLSISHTRGYAAVAYHRDVPIGMDIEYRSSRVERVADRFTSPEEASYMDACSGEDRQMYHLINWSAKEALYKLFDSPSMADLKEAFRIAPYALGECGTLYATINAAVNTKVEVCYHCHPEFVCTCCVFEPLAMSSEL